MNYSDLRFQKQDNGHGSNRLCPSSLLLVAAVHAAGSHFFDRLQLLCDLRQLLRGAVGDIDENWLVEIAKSTGSNLAIATALNLVEKVFASNDSRAVLHQLRLGWAGAIARMLLNPQVVIHSQRTWHTMRRCWFRELQKRQRISVKWRLGSDEA